ncbi:MAG: AAA family ATPase [Candidatus Micrarchaeia archaeon]
MPETKKSQIKKVVYKGNVDKITVTSKNSNQKYNKNDNIQNKKQDNEKNNKKQKKVHEESISVPITYYAIKERLIEFSNNKYFPDSVISFFALLSIAIAFPFYPIIILIPLLAITFILSRYHPSAGLIALLFISLPIFMYQAPLLAWFYVFFMTIALIFGYKHYRAITFAYTLIVLPFSFIGLFIEIPVFVLGILYIGMKRALIGTAIAIVAIPVIAGLTGLTPYGPILFNIAGFRATSGASLAFQYFVPNSQISTLSTFGSNSVLALSRFFEASPYITPGIYLAFLALAYGLIYILVQLVIWLIVVISISSYVVKSRSSYKGTESTLYTLIILISFIAISYLSRSNFSIKIISGFILAPIFLLILEFNDISVVRVLDVMKQDFLGTLGSEFEELGHGVKESLNDIGNYEETKNELKQAIIQPIENKGISKAYHVVPSKGILLFGPPGTGKTMLMRAISQEIRARFIYVKSSAILESTSGDSSKKLSKIFSEARAHTPTILFFDELDSIAVKRTGSSAGSEGELLSDLLVEMDGFQKVEGVVIVGATNVPNIIDPAVLRPGRFDRIIYMPLPDKSGRIEIFKKYAKKYPTSSNLDYEKLSTLTSRFSGADIANIFSITATDVSSKAIKTSSPLKIQTSDLVNTISSIKPSTSFSQLELYEKFRADFERRTNPEKLEKNTDVTLNNVVNIKEAKNALNEAIRIPLEHPTLSAEYNINNITGILMFGPPGCGKTMLMKAFSNEYPDIHLFRIMGSDLIKEGYEKSLETIKESFFRAKENAPSIIFIDEIDSLVPNRDDASELSIKITSEFLREFEELKSTNGIVVVGATNRPEKIDPAVLRPGRIEKLIYVTLPDRNARKELFEKSLPEKTTNTGINYDSLALATVGFTPAEIVNICREAKLKALELTIEKNDDDKPSSDEVKITEDLILSIIKKIKPQTTKSVLSRYELFSSEHTTNKN